MQGFLNVNLTVRYCFDLNWVIDVSTASSSPFSEFHIMEYTLQVDLGHDNRPARSCKLNHKKAKLTLLHVIPIVNRC